MLNHQTFRILRLISCVCALAAGVLSGLAGVSPGRADEPNVYRCTMSDGSIEFRQFPCHGRDESQLLEIDDRPSGWIPPDPSAVFAEEKPKTRSASGSDEASSDARKEDAADRRQAEKCWKKEQQLEQANRKLRAGYRPAEGQRLRHKRAEYEDYLKKFCD